MRRTQSNQSIRRCRTNETKIKTKQESSRQGDEKTGNGYKLMDFYRPRMHELMLVEMKNGSLRGRRGYVLSEGEEED